MPRLRRLIRGMHMAQTPPALTPDPELAKAKREQSLLEKRIDALIDTYRRAGRSYRVH